MCEEKGFVAMKGKLERVRDGAAGCRSEGEKHLANWHGNLAWKFL